MFVSSEIRVLIADDHPIFRHGLRQLLEKDPRIKIVGEADNGEDALALIVTHRPEIALLDVDLPQKDGFAIVHSLRKLRLPTQVVFLTMHKDELHLNEALSLDVRGYVIKESAATDVANCIKLVASGQSYVSPELSTYLLNRSKRAVALAQEKPNVNRLTATERQILLLIAAYKTNREIAEELFVSVRTVENHRANICSKLNLQGAHALMKFALMHKSELS
jgi:DNA-binding NarL/FixJ family response regulator